MNELVKLDNKQIVTSSRKVAEVFKKKHKVVLEAYDNLMNQGVAEFPANSFCETTYVYPQNKQEYREILMNRDGFSLLAMGFTGKKATQWKLKYIEAFNEMEKQLKEVDKKLIEMIDGMRVGIFNNLNKNVIGEVYDKNVHLTSKFIKGLSRNSLIGRAAGFIYDEYLSYCNKNKIEPVSRISLTRRINKYHNLQSKHVRRLGERLQVFSK